MNSVQSIKTKAQKGENLQFLLWLFIFIFADFQNSASNCKRLENVSMKKAFVSQQCSTLLMEYFCWRRWKAESNLLQINLITHMHKAKTKTFLFVDRVSLTERAGGSCLHILLNLSMARMKNISLALSISWKMSIRCVECKRMLVTEFRTNQSSAELPSTATKTCRSFLRTLHIWHHVRFFTLLPLCVN